MTKPGDLSGFGNVSGDFIQTESKLILPKSLTKDSTLEDMETPDQLEERGIEVSEQDTDVQDDSAAFQPKGINLLEKHPDWLPNMEFQVQMFNRMIELCHAESDANSKRMNNIEILLEHYPLWSSSDDVNEMRTLLLRNIEIQAEIIHYEALVKVREDALKPKEKGFWKSLFSWPHN